MPRTRRSRSFLKASSRSIVVLRAALPLLLLALSSCSQSSNEEPPRTASEVARAPAESSQRRSEASPGDQRTSVFVVHHVPDFEAYLKQFEKNAEARTRAGVYRVILVRLMDDSGRVGLHFSAGSRESVDTFLDSEEYKKLARADTATDSTLLWIASDILDELPASLPPSSVSLFKKFPVRDVDCVSRELIPIHEALKGDGLIGFSLHRTDREQVVILHLIAGSRDQVEQVYSGTALRQLLTQCGAENLDQPLIGAHLQL